VSPERHLALLTDTVGFIRKLPHHLVASFHSTLVEAVEADLLIHVVDAADPDILRQMEAVEAVLEELLEEPRPTVLVFNKLDLVTDEEAVAGLEAQYPDAFLVAAKTGAGLDALRVFIWEQAAGHAAGRKPAAVARGAGRSS